ncbi:MAG: SOS response-associated peptidase [Asticcacaulis sp.]
MCGRFEKLVDWHLMKEALRIVERFTLPVQDEIRPTDRYPIITAVPEGHAVLQARWWLLPSSYRGAVKDFKYTTFNARIETAASAPTFANAWIYRHCLVPVGAFYEWSGPKTARQKHRITRADNHPLVFAGLWNRSDTADGTVDSFTILTREAGTDMAQIHTREPVSLVPDEWNNWLNLMPVESLRHPAPSATFRISDAA